MARTGPARTRSMRLTLTTLLIVPLVSLVALWGFAASVTLGNALRDRNYNHLVSTGAKVYDQLETRLAEERLQTFIYLSTGRRSPVAPLTAARAQTNALLVSYRRNQESTRGDSPASLEQAGNILAAQLAKIPGIRAGVDSGALSPSAAFQAYSGLVDAEFALFQATGSIGLNLAVYAQTAASIQAARALEDLGREITLMAGAAAGGGEMSIEDRQLFASAVAGQRLLIGDAIAGMTPQSRLGIQRLYASPAYHQLAAMENTIDASVGAGGLVPVKFTDWESVSGGFLGELEDAQVKLNGPLAQVASQYGNRLLLEAVLAGGLGLVAVIASILLTVWIGRRVSGELTDLHDNVQSMADERLPSVVARLRRGDEVDVAAESPPPAPGRITEIAKVADSFATVQRTAVEAAVGQANLRKGVNQVFLNLSLRNQSLLHRQLAMLDSMERAARDPAGLDELFRLDHLTTRMRRHAEGLIILAGSTPARGWRDPVPVVDVLRAAIAEVEDYVRIDVLSESRDAIAGGAVNDVIHLIAELAENATAFSPPSTQVEIKADAVAHGLAVEIEDRGLGLSADELAEINERLASPPEFDLANSDQLGLFVVGQLAARHGIRVSLRDSAYGGTIAIVLMPTGIVVRDGESEPAGELNGNGQGAGAFALPLPAGPVPAGSLPAGSRPAGPLPAGPVPAGPPAGGPLPAGSGPAGWLPERAAEPGPSASVFSLTGRHRLAAGLPGDVAGSGPWPAAPPPATPAAPPGLPARGLASRSPAPRDTRAQAPWEQPSFDEASWDQPPWDRPAPHVPSWEHQPWARAAAPAAPAPAPAPAPAAQPPAAAEAPATAGTHLGMPVRVRQASLAPQLRRDPAPAAAPAAGPATRSPEQARNLMSALQRGWEHGRTDDLDDPAADLGAWPGGTPGAGTDPSDGEAR
jgi:signal transduction histidine kinase